MASGGSTNAVINLCALAYELGIDTDEVLKEFDRQSSIVPVIVTVNPASNVWDMEDWYKAGGDAESHAKHQKFIQPQAMTVTGKTMEKTWMNTDFFIRRDDDLVRTIDNPHNTLGALPLCEAIWHQTAVWQNLRPSRKSKTVYRRSDLLTAKTNVPKR